jgi:hypothetical protein
MMVGFLHRMMIRQSHLMTSTTPFLRFQEVRDTTIDLDALGVPSYDLVALDVPFLGRGGVRNN